MGNDLRRMASPEMLAWLYNESPVKDEVVVNDRWGKDTRHKHGGYWTTEYTPGMSGMDHPWEESRGMGFSYGYNRAERLEDYHSSRELIVMLSDLVSRGGNLLLDIGPAADGTIPVVMEERLIQMGDWLKINGDAIYGTKPWKATRQWTNGEVPKTDYNAEYATAYDINSLVADPAPGKARIEAFFTTKGRRSLCHPPALARSQLRTQGCDRRQVSHLARRPGSREIQSLSGFGGHTTPRSPRVSVGSTRLGPKNKSLVGASPLQQAAHRLKPISLSRNRGTISRTAASRIAYIRPHARPPPIMQANNAAGRTASQYVLADLLRRPAPIEPNHRPHHAQQQQLFLHLAQSQPAKPIRRA